MSIIFTLVIVALASGEVSDGSYKKADIPYFYSDVQLLWVYPKPIIPKNEISVADVGKYPVYGFAYYDELSRIIKYEKHENGKVDWECAYTYDKNSRHESSTCDEGRGSVRLIKYGDKGAIVENKVVPRKEAGACEAEVVAVFRSPSAKYQIDVQLSSCSWRERNVEAWLRAVAGKEAELLWRTFDVGARSESENGYYYGVKVVWRNDSGVDLYIPKGTRGNVLPEYGGIKITYNEY